MIPPSKHKSFNQCCFNVGQRRRRWPNIETVLGECLVFAVRTASYFYRSVEIRCSLPGDCPMFRRFYVQKKIVEKVLCSEGSIFRRSYVQKVLCSEGPIFRRSYVQKFLCSEKNCSKGPIFRRFYVQKVLYSDIFRRSYIQKILCFTWKKLTSFSFR